MTTNLLNSYVQLTVHCSDKSFYSSFVVSSSDVERESVWN